MSWLEAYRSKIVTPQEALRCVGSGMRVYIHPGCAEPEVLVEALIERAPFVRDVEIVHLLTLGRALGIEAETLGRWTGIPFHLGSLVLLVRLSARLFPGRGGLRGLPVAMLGWALHEDAVGAT